MNRRPCARVSVIALTARYTQGRLFTSLGLAALAPVAWMAGSALAQPAPAAPTAGATATTPAAATTPVPTAAMKTNATPSQAEFTAVDKFIVERVALLGKDASSRDELIAGSTSNNIQNPASVAYLSHYTTTLNKELKPLLTSADMRVRVNAAIVLARVAINAQNAWLQSDVEALLASNQPEAVGVWGLRAASAVLPQPGVQTQSLLKAIVSYAQKHVNSGPVADEAYNCLQPQNVSPTKDTLKAMQDVYQARVAAYEKGLPEDPAADRKPSTFLTEGGGKGMWTLSTPEQQKETARCIANFLENGSKQADATQPGDQREQLMFSITRTAEAVQVIGGAFPDLVADAKTLSHLPISTPPGSVYSTAKPVIDGIRKAFKITS